MNHQVSPLLTDLYQLTMLQGYDRHHMTDTAVFEFFVRKLPSTRNFLIAAGLEQVINYLENLRFGRRDLEWLAATGRFDDDFITYLEKLRFNGDVFAVPEGSIVFPDEPILRIAAPIGQAQLVETRVINLLHFQTLIASKAGRMVLAAPEKILVDFGLRRAHGAEAGLLAARASYLAGFTGTSTVQAGQLFDVPLYGTMAHSFIQAHDREIEAFEHFATAQPDNVVLLIDTYDTEAAAGKVVELARKLRKNNITVQAVRLDSGDLIDLSRKVRRILDNGGLKDVRIFSSGNLDEYVLAHFSENKAPIDGFGIGTRMITAADAPYLDCAYKLVEYAGWPRRKRSAGKATWPGRKQIYRHFDDSGCMAHDILTVEDDRGTGKPLIKPVMRSGRRLQPPPALKECRERVKKSMATLPPSLRQLQQAPAYEVRISKALRKCTAEVDARQARD